MARNDERGKPFRAMNWRTAAAFFFFIAAAFLALRLPDHPGAFSVHAFLKLPLEIPLILLALTLLPRRLALVFAVLSSLALFTLLFLKVADIGVQSAFQRRFNPYLDIKMIGDGWNLFSGTVGTGLAGLAVFLAIAAFVMLFAGTFLAQHRLADLKGRTKHAVVATAFALLIAGGMIWIAGPMLNLKNRADLHALPYLNDRLALVARSVSDMRVFERDLKSADRLSAQDGLFERVKGRDVVLVFVESYGRNAVEDPRYAPIVQPRLDAVGAQLTKAGFFTASGWVKSPTVGGLSWLAHGTFLSGLWVDSQARYDRLMISERASLNRLFQKAGWQTAAIMPAITLDWPEAAYFGYDRIFAAKDLDYRGKPFNWVTMPDQYTLAAFQRLVRNPAQSSGQPVMAEIALISSHAPWTPVPKLIGWDEVGDGTAFNGQAESDEPPRVVWADKDNVRDHYIRTIDYALQTLGDYMARYGDDAVFIILGDHQPASIITGEGASRAVPIHIASRDQLLVERFRAEGFLPGMTPDSALPELPMDTMRERLIRLFSNP